MRSLVRIVAPATLALPLLLPPERVPSLSALYSDEFLYLDRRLIGTWVEEGSDRVSATWTFERAGDVAYVLSRRAGSRTTRFDAHLVRLGGAFFLDLYPEARELERQLGAELRAQLIPAHTFARVRVDDQRVRVATLDPAWLRRMLADGKVSLDYDARDGTVVLTGPTLQLQRFAALFANDSLAWPQSSVWRRKTPRAPR